MATGYGSQRNGNSKTLVLGQRNSALGEGTGISDLRPDNELSLLCGQIHTAQNKGQEETVFFKR